MYFDTLSVQSFEELSGWLTVVDLSLSFVMDFMQIRNCVIKPIFSLHIFFKFVFAHWLILNHLTHFGIDHKKNCMIFNISCVIYVCRDQPGSAHIEKFAFERMMNHFSISCDMKSTLPLSRLSKKKTTITTTKLTISKNRCTSIHKRCRTNTNPKTAFGLSNLPVKQLSHLLLLLNRHHWLHKM